MRTFAFLSLFAVAASSQNAKEGDCLVDGVKAVTDLMDAAMFSFAASKRCDTEGDEIKCDMAITSVVKSVQSIINVILQAVDKCGDLQTENKACGMAANALTIGIEGLTVGAQGVDLKCTAMASSGGNNVGQSLEASDISGHVAPATCVVNMKGTAMHLFGAIKEFMKIEDACEDEESEHCKVTSLHLVAALTGMGDALAGTIGACAPGHLEGIACAQQVQIVTSNLMKVSAAGVDMSRKCKAPGIPMAPPGRLFSVKSGKVQPAPAAGLSVNMLLAAFLPITAIVGFVGGRRLAKKNTLTREFMPVSE